MTASAQTIELLRWISLRPRTYAEAIEAWKTSCPRLSVWDDALCDRLIRIVRGASGSHVALTARGRSALAGARPSPQEA